MAFWVVRARSSPFTIPVIKADFARGTELMWGMVVKRGTGISAGENKESRDVDDLRWKQ